MIKRPRLLDLFCCAGGAAMGYYRAGFDVVGVDIKPQPRYPFAFIQGDALDVLARMLRGEKFLASDGRWYGIEDFAAIHASPPCQAYSVTKSLTNKNHPELVPQTREILAGTGKPYVIENVPGAPLVNPLMLCGTMFGLRVIRHRLFECNPAIWFPPSTCAHEGLATGGRERRLGDTKTPRLSDGYKYVTVAGNNYIANEGRDAMGINWTNKKELSQAIPPAYTEFIGKQMLTVVLNSYCAIAQTD